MPNIRIVYHPDKSISVIYPAPNSRLDGESRADWLDRVYKRTMKYGNFEPECEFEDTTRDALPPDRKHRDAWEGEKGKGISINPTKAIAVDNRKKVDDAYEKELRNGVIEKLKSRGKLDENYNE